ncbi:hypothetical protein LBMAG53_38590 [Planctomycetota bacterium]|nr:hypothetical protein LBMAG53_38590 [Planctomycetota bacterium]
MRCLTMPAPAVPALAVLALALLFLPACAERSYEGGMRSPGMNDDGTTLHTTEKKRSVLGDPPGAMP